MILEEHEVIILPEPFNDSVKIPLMGYDFPPSAPYL